MNKNLMRKAGLGKEVDKVEAGKCPLCDCPKAEETITNQQSLREFRISGMCQSCQDKTFGKEKNPIPIPPKPPDSFRYWYPTDNIKWTDKSNPTHKKLIGKSGRTWLVANIENAASDIHVSDPNPNSQGYGGSTLRFLLEDGTCEELQGPWHTNSDALYKDTGYDIRDKHLTRGVIAKDRNADFLIGILYKEDKPVLGTYHRVKEIAQKIANERKERVFCFMQSRGGSSCGPVEPNGAKNENNKAS